MFTKGLSQATQSDLALLKGMEQLDDFYLAGGSGCALYLGHRLSFDLDFFTLKDFLYEDIYRDLKLRGSFFIEYTSKNTIVGKFNNTKISFFTYPYPLLFPEQRFLNINIADLKDIACMKIDAIGSRGTKRDFIDLYFICQKEDLFTLLELYKKKYKQVRDNIFHIIKSLAYFRDAETANENIVMLKKYDWKDVKKFFEDKVRQIMEKYQPQNIN
ncbi:MAG: nucleotidyl transferase AbiEii/AbiGii toxin family protein [Candidatus Omnitrophica bacterium]|nr:nucleotidyl transferase AbiEii/AbiGii toxin family protein [Candidatus Omnitrophota bacterium]